MLGKAGLRTARIVAVMLILVVGALAWFVYAGAYNVAADAPHFALTKRLLDVGRDQSVAVRAAGIVRPADLGDPKRIAAGAGLYAEMCSGCHLAPGMEPSEISQGLYPRAPLLTKPTGHTPEEEFWIIKHGIKMSGMAAWGVTHSDELIWHMVAFIDKLPSLSADDYQAATKESGDDHEHMMKDMPSDHGASHGPGHKTQDTPSDQKAGDSHDHEHKHKH